MKRKGSATSFGILFLGLAAGVAQAATYTVSLSTDVASSGTLRWAIGAANTNAGPDTIAFNLSSPWTIQPTSQLPNLYRQTTVDGTTQPGFTTSPVVRIDGWTNVPYGFYILGNSNILRGLTITRFAQAAVYIRTSAFNRVEGCWLWSNALYGVWIQDAWTNLIGGTAVTQRNVIAGNGSVGIAIEGSRVMRGGTRSAGRTRAPAT